jgi:hypothetical protein
MLQSSTSVSPLFNYLAPSHSADEKMVSQTFASWNQTVAWLTRLEAVRRLSEQAGWRREQRSKLYRVRSASIGLKAAALRAGK